MTDLFLTGPDALKLLSDTGVNSFAKFQVDNAKQFIAVNHEGYLIGDAILFHLAEESFDLVGHPMVIDWVQYHLETGDYDAQVERDGNSIVRQGPPKLYRYELQGPNALALVEKLIGGPVPPTKFFHMTSFEIAGTTVRALRHGMAGQPGFELFGPWAEGDAIRAALVEAGADLGLVQVGSMGYSSANLESGWVPSPLPAIFTGEGTDAYRAWLGAAGAGSLAGSLLSEDIEDYYVTPYDLGYGRSVAFDHEFIGRAALERFAANQARTKVTLVWNSDDVAAAIGSLFQPGTPAKYMALPEGALRAVPGGRGDARRKAGGHLDGLRLHGQRAGLRVARHDRQLGGRDRHRGHRHLGRGPEHPQAAGRAASPGHDPRHRRAGALPRLRPQQLPRSLTSLTRDTLGQPCGRSATLVRPPFERWPNSPKGGRTRAKGGRAVRVRRSGRRIRQAGP